MASEWRTLELGDLGRIITGKTPLTSIEANFGGAMPFVTPSDMDGRKYIEKTARTLTSRGVGCVKNAVLPAQAVMISCIGSDMGKVALTRTQCVTNQQINSIVVHDEFNPQYVYYDLLRRKTELRSLAAGSAQPILNKGHFAQIPIQIPSRDAQDRITHILGTLDDKVELNRRMNRTLEKMAAALFKSWFIDFDPVHAKAEHRDTGLPAAVADLFPATFQPSTLGLIPTGWTIGSLSEIAKLQTKTIKPGAEPGRIWHHYSIPAFDDGQQPTGDRGDTIKSNKYAVPKAAVLVSKLNPRFPRIWLPDVSDSALAICSTEFMPFVPTEDRWRPYLYELTKSEPMQDSFKSRVTGSTGSRQRVKPKDIAAVPVLVPLSRLIDAYSRVVGDFHGRLLANRRQSQSLTGFRDTLLPKLLSGGIEISESEAAAEKMSS